MRPFGSSQRVPFRGRAPIKLRKVSSLSLSLSFFFFVLSFFFFLFLVFSFCLWFDASSFLVEKPEIPKILFHFNTKFNNLKADMPLQPSDWSLVDSFLVRPIVAYVNANSTRLLLSCDVTMNLEDLNGSMSIYDCGLVNRVSKEMAIQWSQHVKHKKERSKQVKRATLWMVRSFSEDLLYVWNQIRGVESFSTLMNF
jgi:hypothetical protein